MLCLAASLLLGLGPSIAPADEPPASLVDDDGYGYWRELYVEALARRDDARGRLEGAQAAYRNGRHRKRLRGEHKTKVMSDIREAEKDLADAERELEAIPEQARRAGAPAGTLRDFED